MESSDSSSSPPNCCEQYWKRIGYAFLEMLLSFFDFLKTLFCCKTHEEKIVSLEEVGDNSKEIVITEEEKKNFPFLINFPLTDEDKENIHAIFHTVANERFAKLISQNGELRERGKKIDNIHPLRLFAYILTTPVLLEDFHKIRKMKMPLISMFVETPWEEFVRNLTNSFEKHYAKDLINYVEGFATFIEIDKKSLEPYFQDKSWKDLIYFIFDSKKPS